MTPIEEFLQLIVEEAEKKCDLDSDISLEELKAGNSLYAEFNDGFTDTVYYDKSTVKTIPVLFLCRNKDQKRCLEQLEAICRLFQRMKRYPVGSTFYWMDTTIAKEPAKIGRDEDGMYHYSCILNNKIYY